MNTTLIRTAKGKSILIQHDVTSPRPYSRIHLLSGTEGFARKYPVEQIALEPDAHSALDKVRMDSLLVRYEHPFSREIGETGPPGGRSRRYGFHYGLPARILSAPRSAAGYGRVRCGRVVVHRGVERAVGGCRKPSRRDSRLHARGLAETEPVGVRRCALIRNVGFYCL